MVAGRAGNHNDGEEKRDAYRATLSYELDLSWQPSRHWSVSVNGAKTFAQQYNDAIVAQAPNLVSAVSGTTSDQGRAYRANLIAQNRFTKGRLNGFNPNLAFRYRGAPNLGYGVVTKSGVIVLDPTNPIYGPGRYFADMMVEEASEVMTRSRAQPFFIYFALNMPHYPDQGDANGNER